MSFAITAATKPLVEHETRLRAKYESQLRDFEEARALGDETAREPPPPPRFVCWDVTTEKLGEVLAHDDKGVLVKADELSGWLGSMERNNAGVDSGARCNGSMKTGFARLCQAL